MKSIPLSKIEINSKTQIRIKIDDEVIKEYAESMRNGDVFPPITVFECKGRFFLADGFHRFYATKLAKKMIIKCEIKKGSLRDAILFSIGANATHGLKRSNEDKRKSVLTLLQDKIWCKWSAREIARKAHVGHGLVNKIKKELDLTGSKVSDKKVIYNDKHGNKITMSVKNIGSSSKKNKIDKTFREILPKTLFSQLEKHSKKEDVEEIEILKKALKLYFQTEKNRKK